MVAFTNQERTLLIKLIEFRKASTYNYEEESLCLDILDKLEQPDVFLRYSRIDAKLACGHETWVAMPGLSHVYCTKCNAMLSVVSEREVAAVEEDGNAK